MTAKRPEVLTGKTIKAKTNCGSFYLTLNQDDGKLFEIREVLGKSGNCVRNLMEINALLFSILLQLGIENEKVIKTLQKHFVGVKCNSDPFIFKGKQYKSCTDFIGHMILEELGEKDKEQQG